VNSFGHYARYYDLLYRDKDYQSEASFVLDLLRNHRAETDSILDLGCGTGSHAHFLAKSGISVHGVDQSASMLETARIKHQALPISVSGRLTFSHGDVRRVRLSRDFDAVVSLFHVLSYQTHNNDVAETFATAKAHLKPDGLFVFDCWYGPGVLTNLPVVRIKRLEDEAIAVTRIAEPTLHANDNIVDVNYTIFINDREHGAAQELSELHRMRYFFRPEINLFATQAGLQIIAAQEWMKKTEPGANTWNACFVARG
jgi:SAM-dependent methyltransferase